MLFDLGTLAETPPTSFTPLTSHGRDLWIYLLTPGFTLGYHRHVLGVSDITLAKHLNRARAALEADAALADQVRENTYSITPADGLVMANAGAAHLPYWSRRAICEMRRTNAHQAAFGLAAVRRQLAGAAPKAFLKALEKAASDS
jgi:hypothetical protein